VAFFVFAMPVTTPHASLLQQAAASAAGAQSYPAGALYVVATPIGNLADLTLRAIHVLGLVDAIACEDTRHSAPLLRQLGIEGKVLLAVHEHNERDAASGVLARLARGERVAYVSDAGTPAISDPGAALVAAAQAAGYRCVPIPGASSAVAALSVAGDAVVGPFTFVGFLSSRAGERTRAVQQLAANPQTLRRMPGDGVPRTHQAVREREHDAGRQAAGLAGGRRAPQPG
jgi:16S rRNA (cytidine1402-2'-O)-methyltransferase